MALGIKQQNEILVCSGSLDICSATDLGKAVSDNLPNYPQIILDLSAISECDAAGLQMLYAARKYADRYAKRFQVCGIASVVRDKAAALGLPLDELVGEKVNV